MLKTAYVYRYIAENTKPLRINRPKGHDYHGGAVGRHAPRLVRIGDVLPDGHVVASRTPKWKPGVSTRVQDKKNGIDYTHYNSGRIARLPETQPMPEDRVAHNSQQARIIEGMDFSMAEGRVIAHMMDLATSLPQAISALNKSLHLARLDILRGFTDDELLHELMRRRK